MHKKWRSDDHQCLCEKRDKRVNLVADTGCGDDEAAVSALPENWTPKQGGAVLANYLKTQRVNHDNISQDLRQKAAKVNESVDIKVRDIAEALLAHIQQNQRDIDCVVEGNNTDEGKALPPQKRDVALQHIKKLHSARIEEIVKFRCDALTLEKERVEGLKQVVQDNFQRLVAVGHKPPRDLLHDFDDHAYEINQQLLSNSRAYAELEAQLRLQADENMVHAKSNLNQLCLGVSMTCRRESARPCLAKKAETKRPTTSSGEKHGDVSQFVKKSIMADINELDVQSLVNAYTGAIKKVFKEVSKNLTDLHLHLGHREYLNKKPIPITSNVEDIIEKDILGRLFGNLNRTNNMQSYEIPHNDMTSIQKSLWSLIENLRNVYVTLFNAAHIWDTHMLRVAYAQKLTITAVEDLMTNNDLNELSSEVTFNIALEQLRNIPDIEKLELHYEFLVSLLDRTVDLYNIHNTSELEKIMTFMNLVPIMLNILNFDISRFLEKHDKTLIQSMGSTIQQQSVPSSRMTDSTIMDPLSRALLQAKLQEIVLQDFRNGFIDAFESNMKAESVADLITRQARTWVDQISADIDARHSLKMASHSVRLERLNAARDSRLAELSHHATRLDSHLEALSTLIGRLPAEASEFLDVDSPQLYPICYWIDRLQADMNELMSREPLDPEVKQLKFYSYAPRLVMYRKLFENSIDEVLEARKQEVASCAQQARVSNFQMMSQVKLFSEGGRYAPQEATKVLALLIKGAEALESSVSRALEILNNRRTYLLSLADQRMAPIQRVTELVKPNIKNNKKTPPPRTKSQTKNK